MERKMQMLCFFLLQSSVSFPSTVPWHVKYYGSNRSQQDSSRMDEQAEPNCYKMADKLDVHSIVWHPDPLIIQAINQAPPLKPDIKRQSISLAWISQEQPK